MILAESTETQRYLVIQVFRDVGIDDEVTVIHATGCPPPAVLFLFRC